MGLVNREARLVNQNVMQLEELWARSVNSTSRTGQAYPELPTQTRQD